MSVLEFVQARKFKALFRLPYEALPRIHIPERGALWIGLHAFFQTLLSVSTWKCSQLHRVGASQALSFHFWKWACEENHGQGEATPWKAQTVQDAKSERMRTHHLHRWALHRPHADLAPRARGVWKLPVEIPPWPGKLLVPGPTEGRKGHPILYPHAPRWNRGCT